MLDIETIRADFPILGEEVYGNGLVYLDNAATTQKPRMVLERVMHYYERRNSNVHRGVHYLSEQAGMLYESVRESVRTFINAGSTAEIIFTGGTTASINLVADSFGRAFIHPGDEIVITRMEHHSNIVPWQVLCEQRGATLKVADLDEKGNLLSESLESLITDRTGLVAVTWVSNALGTVNPIQDIIALAHARDVPVLVDAAQAIQHLPVDVRELDCDFLVFSGHKIYAETGIGVLYGKEKWLDAMPPYQTGGGMIADVNIRHTTCADLPLKFEAGTGNIAAAVSLGAALEYLEAIGLDAVHAHENEVLAQAVEIIGKLDGVIQYGDRQRCSILSFNLENVHSYDTGMILDKMGVAVRTGLHCTQPLMEHLGISGTVRASFALYNTLEDVERLAAAIQKAQAMLSPDYSGAQYTASD